MRRTFEGGSIVGMCVSYQEEAFGTRWLQGRVMGGQAQFPPGHFPFVFIQLQADSLDSLQITQEQVTANPGSG